MNLYSFMLINKDASMIYSTLSFFCVAFLCGSVRVLVTKRVDYYNFEFL